MKTDQGTLTVSPDRAKTPCTTNGFLSLARQRPFDGTGCHRLTTVGIYVLQCGDPCGTGAGGPGYSLPDENLCLDRTRPMFYPAGTIAMANAGPGTNGRQFFIVYRDSALAGAYTIFGKVTAGLDAVRHVPAAGSDPVRDGRPKKPVTVTAVSVA
ncbi:MAG: peptidylprolyl isomerase [Pseudonocardiales bacterium]